METTLWFNEITAQRVTTVELGALQLQARRLYEANTHVFEDVQDALGALGVVPLWRHVAALSEV